MKTHDYRSRFAKQATVWSLKSWRSHFIKDSSGMRRKYCYVGSYVSFNEYGYEFQHHHYFRVKLDSDVNVFDFLIYSVSRLLTWTSVGYVLEDTCIPWTVFVGQKSHEYRMTHSLCKKTRGSLYNKRKSTKSCRMIHFFIIWFGFYGFLFLLHFRASWKCGDCFSVPSICFQ